MATDQALLLLPLLDAFGDHRQFQVVRHGDDDALHDGGIAAAGGDVLDRILYQAKDDGRNRVESVTEAPLLTSVPQE